MDSQCSFGFAKVMGEGVYGGDSGLDKEGNADEAVKVNNEEILHRKN